MNKTIYMTYKKQVPEFVFSRWKELNKDYNIDFSLDEDCINFLKTNFNDYIAILFCSIPQGMYKADLWRLCKLYINGGVYSDVDLVPHINIDTLDQDVTFYSCLSMLNFSIFQAFMSVTKPKSPLVLNFLLSFLLNNPYNYHLGPTADMYKCISYNLNGIQVLPDTKYDIDEIKIKVDIGSCSENIKHINLFFFPDDVNYTIKLNDLNSHDKFNFSIENNVLIVTKNDSTMGWQTEYSVNICIKSNEKILLFRENTGENENWIESFVSHNNVKILDSRDLNYYYSGGW